MQRFNIKGEEHEIKLNLDAIKYLSGLNEGAAMALIGKALVGDIETYENIIYAGLFHTGKGFTKKDVQAEIEKAIEEERLDLDEINRTCYAVVADNFFYKKTVERMFKDDPKAKAQIEKLMR
ncbi:tail assembly chaperone [Terribacillus sp. 179-K 1B1 HS]|uniref:tail assembly chaperone n=1 Tax=Terribacillus sp. 179-K 1B1 HS TaxID=3142388 RepID=UPI0039A0B1DE